MKKQTLVFLFFIFFWTLCKSQNYQKVDSIVLTYPKSFNSTIKLAKRISTNFSNDFEQVRAVYTWIINNVIYEPSEYRKYDFEYSSGSEFKKKQNKFEKKLSVRTLSKGKAVCEGYSILFKVLCNNLNIESKIVSGSSKTIVNDIGKRYSSDHAWNIVQIEDKKYLIDVTWGAGTYEEDQFEKKANYYYFLTSPNLFIKDHYPDYYENSLLKENITKQDFLNYPLIYNHDFKLLNPINGIIKKEDSDKIKFKFLSDKKVRSISYDIDKKNYEVTEFNNNKNLEFEIFLTDSKKTKELVLYFDYEPVIAFKLK